MNSPNLSLISSIASDAFRCRSFPISNELEVKKGEIRIVPAKIKKNIVDNSLLLSEKSLGADWNRPEEDEAWKTLQ
jgi:hypothetical protein